MTTTSPKTDRNDTLARQVATFFTARLDVVVERTAALGIEPTQAGALRAADELVHAAVLDALNACTATTDDVAVADLARRVVAGDLTAASMWSALDSSLDLARPDGTTRREQVAAALARAANAKIDRQGLRPVDLRHDVADQWHASMVDRASSMVVSILDAPDQFRTVLADEGPGPRRGVETVTPYAWLTGELRHTPADMLVSARALEQAWTGVTAGPHTHPGHARALYYLANGKPPETTPALDVELLYCPTTTCHLLDESSLSYLVATGAVAALAPLSDPFGDDHDEYARRVAARTAGGA